jgi:predicted acyl esterase
MHLMSTANGPVIKTRPVAKVDNVKHSFVETSPGTKILSSGNVQVEGHSPLHCDILVEEDVKIPMRDGITLYADVYRPLNSKPGTIPAIIAAGPFGKSGGPNKTNFNRWPWRYGCPRKATSGLEKFEGPDPGYWCYHGYAVVHTGRQNTPVSSHTR